MGNPARRAGRSRFPLTSQILLLQIVIIVGTLAVGAYVSLRFTRAQLDEQYGARALAIAESVSATPAVRDAFDDPDPPATIQPIAEAVRRATGATFVVVGNTDGIRYSHPNPANIGKRVSTDPGPALEGREYVAVETGTLGRSVRGKTPIMDDDGTVFGFVSVGILEEEVGAQLRRDLPHVLTWLGVALLLGAVGSVLLARRIKRQTFGLEPEEIARLLENREAVLHGIREGVLVPTPAAYSPWPTTRPAGCSASVPTRSTDRRPRSSSTGGCAKWRSGEPTSPTRSSWPASASSSSTG